MPADTYRVEIQATKFDRAYPFREVLAVLSGFDAILESSFRILCDEAGIAPVDRPSLNIFGDQPVVGSYLQDLRIVIDTAGSVAPIAAPLIAQLTPWQVFEMAKKGVEIAKWVMDKILHEEKLPTIHIENTKGDAIVAAKNSHITVNHFHLYAAVAAEDAVFQMTDALASGKIDSAVLASDKEKISLTSDDKDLSKAKLLKKKPMESLLRSYEKKLAPRSGSPALRSVGMQNDLMELFGEVTAFNKQRKSGTFHVSAGQRIPEGDYKFKIASKEPVDTYILAMRQSNTRLSCRIVTRAGRTKLRALGIKQGA